jgi:molybdenum cofactor biosynthesis enzyme MoaA
MVLARTSHASAGRDRWRLESLDLYITSQCNRRCEYCFLPLEYFASRTLMTSSLFGDVLRWASAEEIPEITLLGGEPSLHPEFARFVEDVGAAGMACRVVTNGAQRFRRLLGDGFIGPRNLSRVAVSIDTLDQELQDSFRGPGAWQDAMDTIAMLGRCGVTIDVNVTAIRPVLDGIPNLIDFAALMGCRRVNVHWPSVMGLGRKLSADTIPDRAAWEAMIERVRAHVAPDASCFVEIERAFLREGEPLTGCALADSSNLQILPDGSAYRCGLLVDDREMASLRFAQGEVLLDSDGGEERIKRGARDCSSCPAIRSTERRACIYDKLVIGGGALTPAAVEAGQRATT